MLKVLYVIRRKKILEENDLKKAKTLIEKGNFAEIMNYMLEKNQKLEQKIISWNEMWGIYADL